ncbi:unnamed protein product, partial [Effrenium voratum]
MALPGAWPTLSPTGGCYSRRPKAASGSNFLPVPKRFAHLPPPTRTVHICSCGPMIVGMLVLRAARRPARRFWSSRCVRTAQRGPRQSGLLGQTTGMPGADVDGSTNAKNVPFGMKISPSATLQNLLRHYPSGGQFFLEALQNAEDTDRATHFCALLDLSTHPIEQIRPQQSVWRRRLQGPAILFYDNGGFRDKDWKSLQQIYNSSKKHSPSEVGKYGMGSRSFFHIGDILQIVSGSKYAILDPDERLSENGEYGEKLDFLADTFDGQRFVDAFPDECSPFHGLGHTMQEALNGTIIRVPLRAQQWAAESSFMPEAFTLERASHIFEDFAKAFSGPMALFLCRVSRLELFVRKEKLLRVASLELRPEPALPGKELVKVKEFLKKFETVEQLQEQLRQGTPTPEVLDIVRMEKITSPTDDKGQDFEEEVKEAKEEVKEAKEEVERAKKEVKEAKASGRTKESEVGGSSSRWLRFGRFFSLEEVSSPPEEVPFVCLALPLDGPCEGLAFAHLPLSIKTGLPVHVHAGFALEDNRRGMWRHAEDTDGSHRSWADWNEHIIGKVVPEVYADALTYLAQHEVMADADVFGLWPRLEAEKDGFQVVNKQLVALLANRLVLRSAGCSKMPVAPQEACFLETHTTHLEQLRADLQNLCEKAGRKVVNPPQHVVELLVHYKAIEKFDCLDAVRDILRLGSEEMPQELLSQILLALLHWAGKSFNSTQLEVLAELLRKVEWVPTPSGHVTIDQAFDPVAPLPDLHVVQQG